VPGDDVGLQPQDAGVVGAQALHAVVDVHWTRERLPRSVSVKSNLDRSKG
jgi:hypothetical protein